PKGFNRKLQETIQKEHGEKAVSMRVNDELSDWILTKVRGEYRPSSMRSTASKALWRAFRALAAARYHLREDPELSDGVRALRDQVETYWTRATPLHRNGEEEESQPLSGPSSGTALQARTSRTLRRPNSFCSASTVSPSGITRRERERSRGAGSPLSSPTRSHTGETPGCASSTARARANASSGTDEPSSSSIWSASSPVAVTSSRGRAESRKIGGSSA